MVGPAPGDVPYYGSVRMLARAVDDLYLMFSYIRVCAVLLGYIQLNSYWGCGQVFHYNKKFNGAFENRVNTNM